MDPPSIVPFTPLLVSGLPFSLTSPSAWWLTALTIAAYVLALLATVHVLRQRKEPMAMLAWIFGFLLMPALGVILYFLIGERRVQRRARRKRKRRAYILRALQSAAQGWEGEDLEFKPQGSGSLFRLDPSLLKLAEVSSKLSNSPLTLGNKVEIFTSAREIYGDLLRAIDRAKQHVHLEYYI